MTCDEKLSVFLSFLLAAIILNNQSRFFIHFFFRGNSTLHSLDGCIEEKSTMGAVLRSLQQALSAAIYFSFLCFQ